MSKYNGLPLPYPDELLYGVITRYHMRTCNSSPKWTLRELFGTANVIPTFDLPSHLDVLARGSQVTEISSDGWIEKHTLYPYYTPFLPKERRDRLRQMMKSNDGSGIHVLVGIATSSVDRNGALHFCPSCFEEDIRLFGEPYWHRIHQTPGVLVCPKHNDVLHRITYPVSDRHGLTVLPIARHLFQSEPVLLNLSDRLQLRLHEIARDTQCLLTQGCLLDLYDIRDSLLHKLSEQSWLTPSHRIRQRELEEQFTTFYGKELLEMLGCNIYGNEYCWLAVATRRARRSIHPLKQLLLIRFLLGSFKHFLEQRNKIYSPFGEAPWPCLNKAADHYRESFIQNAKTTRCSDTGRPVGTFTCTCGFSYSRRGPDQTAEDRYRIGRIKAFGPVWKRQLGVYMDKSLSYRAAAEKLGVDTNTIIKYARLNSPDETLCHEDVQTTSLINKTKDRKVKNSARKIRVDWEKRDLQLSWQVEEACQKLLEHQQLKPIRITIASVGKQIGKLSLLEKHKDRLPITMTILSRYLETIEQFQLRRIQWAAEQMHNEFPIKRWKLIKKAGIRTGYSPAVSAALDHYSGYGMDKLSSADEVMTQWLQ
ncbi:hypothetical protein D3C76_248770 [compost metagenome]